MILFLLSNIVQCSVLSIDLGSEYFKMAQSSLSGEPQMILNSNSQVTTPAAIAFRSSRNISKPIDPDSIFKYQVRFGSQAVKLLKKNSSLGFRYLNRLIGRSNQSEFYTSNLANISELFAITLYNLVGKHSYTEGISFVIPQFWTNEQRVAISAACSIADLPILTILDDFTAISLLYGSLRNHKYKKAPKHILFIDVGSTSCKSYGARFIWQKDSSFVKQTSAFWSEKCGGYYMSKSIAEAKNISIKKATKLLSQNDPSILPYINPSLDELRKIIQESMELSSKSYGPFDEIQVTGGASQYRAVIDTILNETGASKIQRDFNANEAFALGGVIAGLQTTETNVYPSVDVKRLPIFSINVTCGNVSQKYCTRNGQCEGYIILNCSGCKTIQLLAPYEDVPNGTSNRVAEYELVNISKLKIDNDSDPQGIISMETPDALIEKIVWCSKKSDAVCLPIDNHPYFRQKKELDLSKKWGTTYIELIRSKQRKMKLLEKIDGQLKVLAEMVLPKDGKPDGVNVFSLGEPYKEVFMERYNEYNAGKMHNWDEGEVLGAQEDLDEIMKNLAKQF